MTYVRLRDTKKISFVSFELYLIVMIEPSMCFQKMRDNEAMYHPVCCKLFINI